MQLIGFNLKKIHAERSPEFKRGAVNTNIEFTDIVKEKIELINNEALRISFLFDVVYTEAQNKELKLGQIVFEGDILFSADKEESKNILKSWKDKKIPDEIRLQMINLVLKRCSTKAFNLEEDLNLPYHIPLDIRPSPPQQ